MSTRLALRVGPTRTCVYVYSNLYFRTFESTKVLSKYFRTFVPSYECSTRTHTVKRTFVLFKVSSCPHLLEIQNIFEDNTIIKDIYLRI